MDVQAVALLIFLVHITNLSTYMPETYFKLANSELTAKEGSCIEIKCIVSKGVTTDGAYWFWMKDAIWDEGDFNAIIVHSTNDSRRPVSPEFLGRVKYIGSSPSSWNQNSESREKKLCSIIICNLKAADSGQYAFRFVGDILWRTKSVNLKVIDNRCPLTFEKPPPVNASDTITLTCSTLNSCPSNLQIENLTQDQARLLSTFQPNNKKSITVSFTARWWDDGKMFSCKTQDETDKYLIRNISVTVEYAPRDMLAEKSKSSVKEGDSVTLSCSAKGGPPPNISWFKEQEMQSTEARWNITSIEESQGGEYYCKAQNRHGILSSNPIIIIVTYVPSVKISPTSSVSEVKQNDEMILKCDVIRSNPEPDTYTWYKDSTKVGQTQTYVVPSMKPEDSGSYKCTATNSAGTGHSELLQIKVQYRPRQTSISSFPDFSVKVGSPLTLTCNTDANPTPEFYSWSHYNGHMQMNSSQWGSSKAIHLGRVERGNEACYVCKATNSIDTGDDSEPKCIKVKYPPTEPTLSMAAEVMEGQPITINCTVESFPPSMLFLTRTSSNHWPVNFTPHGIELHHVNTLLYRFNASSTHTGSYICNAENSEGSKTSKQRKLVVKYTPKDVTVQAKPGLVVNENTALILRCNARSYPPVSSVTWMKTADGKDETIQQTVNFTITSASPSDSGLYSCAVSNEIGTGRSQRAEVKVRYAPKHTNIMKAAEKLEHDGSRSVLLSCSSQSYPPVQHYSWYQKMEGKGGDKILSRKQNYTVYSNKPGIYYCVAKNEINQTSSEPVDLFNRDFMTILKFLCPLLIILLVILFIFLFYRYRKRPTNTQPQIGFSGWWNGTRRASLMNETVLVEPFRSRDDLLPDQSCRPKAQQSQPHPDSMPVTNISTVYSIVNVTPVKQASQENASTAQKPTRQEDHSLNYAFLHFWNMPKDKLAKAEEDVYTKVSKPSKKHEQERLEDYENICLAHALKSPNPLNDDTDTSEDEVELNYSQVSFNTKSGHQTANRDSSSSDEDEIQYSDVKI